MSSRFLENVFGGMIQAIKGWFIYGEIKWLIQNAITCRLFIIQEYKKTSFMSMDLESFPPEVGIKEEVLPSTAVPMCDAEL